MPIKSVLEIFRDYETDGVPASGPHEPNKSDIREWGGALESGLLATPRIITVAGSYPVADSDVLIVVNLATPGTVALTLGAIANRSRVALTVADYAKTAPATITLTPNGAEEIGGRTGPECWTMTSAGVGMGASQKFIPCPDLTPNGWIVAL